MVSWQRNTIQAWEAGCGKSKAYWNYKATSLNNVSAARGGQRFAKANDLSAIYQAQGGKCYYCGLDVKMGTNGVSRRESLSFDHVVPNVNEVFNLVMACHSCNMRKSNTTVEALENMAARVRQFMTENAALYADTEAATTPDGYRKFQSRQIDLFAGDEAV